MTYQREKIVQVLDSIAYKLPGKRLSKLTALKLVYLADRYHIRKYAVPIIWDTYYAMKFGPVASNVKTLIEDICRSPRLTDFISVEESHMTRSCGGNIMYITSLKAPDDDMMSETEREAIDAALSQWPLHEDLISFTHQFPEWLAVKDRLDKGATRVKMSYLDFFLPCKNARSEYCDAEQDLVDMNREIFSEEASFRLKRA